MENKNTFYAWFPIQLRWLRDVLLAYSPIAWWRRPSRVRAVPCPVYVRTVLTYLPPCYRFRIFRPSRAARDFATTSASSVRRRCIIYSAVVTRAPLFNDRTQPRSPILCRNGSRFQRNCAWIRVAKTNYNTYINNGCSVDTRTDRSGRIYAERICYALFVYVREEIT